MMGKYQGYQDFHFRIFQFTEMMYLLDLLVFGACLINLIIFCSISSCLGHHSKTYLKDINITVGKCHKTHQLTKSIQVDDVPKNSQCTGFQYLKSGDERNLCQRYFDNNDVYHCKCKNENSCCSSQEAIYFCEMCYHNRNIWQKLHDHQDYLTSNQPIKKKIVHFSS